MGANGIDNLVPQSERTKEEQRKIARMGGIASGEARRAKRDMRERMKMMLEEKPKGKDYTYADRLTIYEYAQEHEQPNLYELVIAIEEKSREQIASYVKEHEEILNGWMATYG